MAAQFIVNVRCPLVIWDSEPEQFDLLVPVPAWCGIDAVLVGRVILLMKRWECKPGDVCVLLEDFCSAWYGLLAIVTRLPFSPHAPDVYFLNSIRQFITQSGPAFSTPK
jgi:hypothetical protein